MARRARFRGGDAYRPARDHVSKKRYPPESQVPFARMSPRLLPAARESEIFAMMRAPHGPGEASPSTKGDTVSKQILVDAVTKTGVKSEAANEAVEAIVAAITNALTKNHPSTLADSSP